MKDPRDLMRSVTIFCKMEDCKYGSVLPITSDGFHQCLSPYGLLTILPGESGPMCETYERIEEAEA